MFYQVYFRDNDFGTNPKSDNHIIGDKIRVIPSPFGGTGNLEFTHPDTIWLGNTHFRADKIKTDSGSVWKVLTRSSLDEDAEIWQPLWERKGLWSYKGDHELESLFE